MARARKANHRTVVNVGSEAEHFPDLKAGSILANQPFNISDWRGDLLLKDQRRQFGVPPTGNANFVCVRHIIHHLAPPGQLLYSTQIPACLWFLARDKSGKAPAPSLGDTASTATCSRPAATSALTQRTATASHSRRRCSASPRNCAQQAEAWRLDEAIWRNLKELRYDA